MVFTVHPPPPTHTHHLRPSRSKGSSGPMPLELQEFDYELYLLQIFPEKSELRK